MGKWQVSYLQTKYGKLSCPEHVPTIENAQKGLCKVKFAKFTCVRDNQYSMSGSLVV